MTELVIQLAINFEIYSAQGKNSLLIATILGSVQALTQSTRVIFRSGLVNLDTIELLVAIRHQLIQNTSFKILLSGEFDCLFWYESSA